MGAELGAAGRIAFRSVTCPPLPVAVLQGGGVTVRTRSRNRGEGAQPAVHPIMRCGDLPAALDLHSLRRWPDFEPQRLQLGGHPALVDHRVSDEVCLDE